MLLDKMLLVARIIQMLMVYRLCKTHDIVTDEMPMNLADVNFILLVLDIRQF